jgi:lipopolysaccharide export system protein LptA
LQTCQNRCKLTRFLLILIFSAANLKGYAQKVTKIELLGADMLEFDQSLGNNARRLIGNVVFKQENTLIYCDSAYLYSENNSMDAFGHIHINQSDSVHIYGDLLKYNGNNKQAKILNNVRMVDREMTLKSGNLTYDLAKKYSFYTGGGVVVGKNNDTLISDIGYFYSRSNELFFKDNVILITEDYVIQTDTMKHQNDVAFFYGPTTMTGKDNFIYCESGWYDIKKELALFKKNSYILSKEQKLEADSLHYNKLAGIGKAYSNVTITDTVNKMIITGQYALFHEKEDQSWITGKPLLTMLFDTDSLFLHADTLYAHMDTTGEHRIIHAYHKTKFFKQDMQGVCDSLVYSMSDSLISLFRAPVLWSDGNQMTANFITIKTADGKIDQMKMDVNAFIISEEDTAHFNQIKGKNILASFQNNELYRIDVNGDGETLYWTREDNGPIFGLNKAKSPDLLIFLQNKEMQSISFLQKTEGTLFPIEDTKAEDKKLKDFVWYDAVRPKSKSDIFIR